LAEKALYFLQKRKGYVASEIVVDITSGTKVMSATIAALAVLHGLYAVTYVGGKRDEKGIVIKGTEKPDSVKPVRILLGHDLNRIKDFFAIFQFDASKKVIDRLLEESYWLGEDQNEKQRMLDIKQIIEAFISWERFDHKDALSHFEQVKLQNVSKQQSYLDKLTTERNRVSARCSSTNPTLQGQVPTTYLITDIFQNARRMSQEGNFDDAVARLYRCLEMVVQYILLDQYRLVSSDIDLEKLKNIININNNNDERTRDTLFQKLANKKNGRQKVEAGLVEGFEILSALNREHLVAKEYLTKTESLKQSLAFRNRSILAHGVVPVDKDKYEEMDEIVINFVQRLIPDIEDRLNKLDVCFKADIL
jgi:CRISPR-associated protein (TIGR02710 family)